MVIIQSAMNTFVSRNIPLLHTAMSYARVHTLKCHKDSVNCLAFSLDGKYLASGADDCTVYVHECQRGLEKQKIVAKFAVTALAWISPGKLLIGYGSGEMALVDVLKVRP